VARNAHVLAIGVSRCDRRRRSTNTMINREASHRVDRPDAGAGRTWPWGLRRAGHPAPKTRFFTADHSCRPKLPALAWSARIDRDQHVTITHGKWVETDAASAVEGAWSCRFEDRDFPAAMTFTGTGIRVTPDVVVAATPTHTLQPVYSTRTPDAVLFANSLAFLLVAANDGLDVNYRRYDHDLMSVMNGLREYVRTIPTRSGRGVRVHYHANVEVSGGLTLREVPKAATRPFETFDDYHSFLVTEVQSVVANAADAARILRYRPVTTVSSGYDSPTCAVLARAAGCAEAITFTRAQGNFADREDSGRHVADYLSLSCTEHDPQAYLSRDDFPEAEFVAAGTGGDDIVYVALEGALPGVLLFTGYHGDKIWARSGVHPSRDIVRGDPSGGSLTEFRLRVGFLNLPVPFIGCTEHRSIHAVSNSSQMKSWSRDAAYDRPIPRRIVESAGVPGHLFGQTKKAVALPYQTTQTRNPPLTEWLTRNSQLNFEQWLQMHPVFTSPWDRLWFGLMHRLYWLNVGGLAKARRCAAPIGMSRVLPCLPWIADSYAKQRSEHMVLFHWGMERMMDRYRAAMRDR
jgi:hypothetical protein